MSQSMLRLVAGGALVAMAVLVLSVRGAGAAPGGQYVGDAIDLTVGADGKVSAGYTVLNPRDGCASNVQAFGLPIQASGGFRVDQNNTLGVLAGRPTPNEAVTIIGVWDGFAQTGTAGVITTEPAAGSNCAPVRQAWRAVSSASSSFGSNVFEGATGPVTIVGRSAPSGTVTLSMNAKSDALSSFSVSVQDGACSYIGTIATADFPLGITTPLMLESSSFFGSPGFGMLSGVTVPGGARGGLVLIGREGCPTIAAMFTAVAAGGTLAPIPAPTTSTPAATPTPTATPVATPVVTATPTPTATPVATATPAPTPAATATPATGAARFIGTPIFGTGTQAFAVFSGGAAADLEAQAKTSGATGVWVQGASGSYHLLVVGGPTFINDSFRTAFTAGLPVNTPVTLTR